MDHRQGRLLRAHSGEPGVKNRINRGDGSLARHAVTCGQEIGWEKGKIIGKEKGWTQEIFGRD